MAFLIEQVRCPINCSGQSDSSISNNQFVGFDSFWHVVHLRELVDGGDGHVSVLVDVVGADVGEEGAGHSGVTVVAEKLFEDVQAGHLADELENWTVVTTLTHNQDLLIVFTVNA